MNEKPTMLMRKGLGGSHLTQSRKVLDSVSGTSTKEEGVRSMDEVIDGMMKRRQGQKISAPTGPRVYDGIFGEDKSASDAPTARPGAVQDSDQKIGTTKQRQGSGIVEDSNAVGRAFGIPHGGKR